MPRAQPMGGMVFEVTATASDGTLDDRDLVATIVGLPDAVFVLDGAGVVRWGNAAVESLFGWPLADWIGRSGLELVHPDDLELVTLSLSSVQQKSVGTAIEVRVKTSSGWRLVEVVGAPIADAGGAVVFCARDLTERRRWEVAGDEVAKFRSLMQNAATITMLVSGDGTVEAASAALTRLLGHDPEVVVGHSLAGLVEPTDRGLLASALSRARSTAPSDVSGPVSVEVRLRRRRDGPAVPFALTIVNLLDDPTVSGLVVSGHDVSDRKAVETELRETLSLLSATLDATADGILVVDTAGHITSFNRNFAEMWCLPKAILDSRDDDVALAFVVGQLRSPDVFLAKVRELYADPEAESIDTLEFKDGRVIERSSKPQRVGDKVVGRVWSFSDVTERKNLEAELAHQAFHDPLTGLANQALFRDRVDHALTRVERNSARLAVLFIDLDNFKTVNDSLGHTRGDELLAAVSGRIRGCIRAMDTAARLGGDEFAVLLEDLSDATDATTLADKVIAALRRPFVIADMDLTVTASIGIAFDTPGTNVDQLLRNADLAMYTAKSSGKARHAMYEPEMHEAAVERLEVEADLRRATRHGELVVYYQPIVELSTGAITGAEALVRWRHPSRGLLMPASFIPLAEETGRIDDIGRFVLFEACAQARRWQDEAVSERPLVIGVNLSPRELARQGIARDVAEALARAEISPADLVLEITESAVMADDLTVLKNLKGLTDLGVRLAIDDFGTGYASLSYLRRFPIGILKIDGSFITSIEDGPDGAALARAIVKLAHNLGLEAVAEQVESRVQADFLRDLGCHQAQGYYFGRPQEAGAFTQRLRPST